jgi:hypothetical protein
MAALSSVQRYASPEQDTREKFHVFLHLNDVRHPHCFDHSMEILRTLGQIPLMFIGAFLIVLAIGGVWAFAQSRSRRVRNP